MWKRTLIYFLDVSNVRVARLRRKECDNWKKSSTVCSGSFSHLAHLMRRILYCWFFLYNYFEDGGNYKSLLRRHNKIVATWHMEGVKYGKCSCNCRLNWKVSPRIIEIQVYCWKSRLATSNGHISTSWFSVHVHKKNNLKLHCEHAILQKDCLNKTVLSGLGLKLMCLRGLQKVQRCSWSTRKSHLGSFPIENDAFRKWKKRQSSTEWQAVRRGGGAHFHRQKKTVCDERVCLCMCACVGSWCEWLSSFLSEHRNIISI